MSVTTSTTHIHNRNALPHEWQSLIEALAQRGSLVHVGMVDTLMSVRQRLEPDVEGHSPTSAR